MELVIRNDRINIIRHTSDFRKIAFRKTFPTRTADQVVGWVLVTISGLFSLILHHFEYSIHSQALVRID